MAKKDGLFKKAYKIWLFIGHILGAINSRIILTIIYYFIFSPAAVVLRIFKHDNLNLSMESNRETYRVEPGNVSISPNPY